MPRRVSIRELLLIAEGVETAPQREFLEAQGCHMLHGYFLSRPMPAAEFARWLAARPTPAS